MSIGMGHCRPSGYGGLYLVDMIENVYIKIGGGAVHEDFT